MLVFILRLYYNARFKKHKVTTYLLCLPLYDSEQFAVALTQVYAGSVFLLFHDSRLLSLTAVYMYMLQQLKFQISLYTLKYSSNMTLSLLLTFYALDGVYCSKSVSS